MYSSIVLVLQNALLRLLENSLSRSNFTLEENWHIFFVHHILLIKSNLWIPFSSANTKCSSWMFTQYFQLREWTGRDFQFRWVSLKTDETFKKIQTWYDVRIRETKETYIRCFREFLTADANSSLIVPSNLSVTKFRNVFGKRNSAAKSWKMKHVLRCFVE